MSAVQSPPEKRTAPVNHPVDRQGNDLLIPIAVRQPRSATPLPPEEPPQTPGGAWRGGFPSLRVVLGILILLLLVALSALALSERSTRHPVPAPNALQPTGTVVSTNPVTEAMIIRTPQGRLENVGTSHRIHLLSRDAHALSPAAVRPGDGVVVSPSSIVDLSQRWVTLKGAVVAPPEQGGGTMIVQVGASQGVVVSLVPATRIDGSEITPTSLLSIAHAPQVRVSGLLDTQLGEMTQTDSLWLL